MDEWILVDNRALIRVADIAAITIDDGLNCYQVHYRNCDGVPLHCTEYPDLDEAQHAIAEFMLSFEKVEEPQNSYYDELVKQAGTRFQQTPITPAPSDYKTTTPTFGSGTVF